MFTLDTLTKTKVLDTRILSSKDRKPDEPPGAQLLLQATLGVGVLAMFDGFLPGMLYGKAKGKPQGELGGMETAELTSIGEHVKRLPWVYEQTGCELLIDLGIGGKSNLVLSDCKVHRISMRPEQKGVVLQWTVDVPGLNDATRGKLTGLKSTEISIMMSGPEADEDQGELEPEKPAKAAKKSAKSDDQVREDALLAAHGGPVQ